MPRMTARSLARIVLVLAAVALLAMLAVGAQASVRVRVLGTVAPSNPVTTVGGQSAG